MAEWLREEIEEDAAVETVESIVSDLALWIPAISALSTLGVFFGVWRLADFDAGKATVIARASDPSALLFLFAATTAIIGGVAVAFGVVAAIIRGFGLSIERRADITWTTLTVTGLYSPVWLLSWLNPKLGGRWFEIWGLPVFTGLLIVLLGCYPGRTELLENLNRNPRQANIETARSSSADSGERQEPVGRAPGTKKVPLDSRRAVVSIITVALSANAAIWWTELRPVEVIEVNTLHESVQGFVIGDSGDWITLLDSSGELLFVPNSSVTCRYLRGRDRPDHCP